MEEVELIGESQRCSHTHLHFTLKKSIKDTWNQAKLLVWKNMLVLTRHKSSSLMQFLVPFMICVHMSLVQLASNSVMQTQNVLNHSEYPIDFPSEEGCAKLMVGYTNGTTPLTDHVVAHVAQNYDLDVGKDLLSYPHLDYDGFQKQIRSRCTSAGVLFCTGRIPVPYTNYSLPCSSHEATTFDAYIIMYNYSSISKMFMISDSLTIKPDMGALATKLSVDAAIADFYAKQHDLEVPFFEAIIQEFPTTTFRLLEGFDVVGASGAFYFYMVPMVCFVMTLTEIVREKDQKLRQGLNVMGLKHSSYWVSWYVTSIVVNSLVANSTILAGLIFQYDFFWNTPYLVLFWIFFLFSFNMSILAFCISTFVKTLISAYSVTTMQVSLSFVLGGLVLEGFFASHILVMFIHTDRVPEWGSWILYLLTYYPPFNFSIVFNDIARKAASHPDYNERRWVPGIEYTYSDYFSPRTGSIKGSEYYIPPSSYYMNFLLRDILVFTVLTWYLDHIIESNRGNSE